MKISVNYTYISLLYLTIGGIFLIRNFWMVQIRSSISHPKYCDYLTFLEIWKYQTMHMIYLLKPDFGIVAGFISIAQPLLIAQREQMSIYIRASFLKIECCNFDNLHAII